MTLTFCRLNLSIGINRGTQEHSGHGLFLGRSRDPAARRPLPPLYIISITRARTSSCRRRAGARRRRRETQGFRLFPRPAGLPLLEERGHSLAALGGGPDAGESRRRV